MSKKQILMNINNNNGAPKTDWEAIGWLVFTLIMLFGVMYIFNLANSSEVHALYSRMLMH